MTDAEFAILSLIAEEARHGYEIEQVIEERGMREWTEVGFSSIYYLLNKLEKKGLAAAQVETVAGKGPSRKRYEITENGRQAYLANTLSALAVPENRNSSLLLGLANLPAVGQAAGRGALADRRKALVEQLGGLEVRREAQQPLPDFVEAMFEYSVRMITAEIEWLDDYLEQLG